MLLTHTPQGPPTILHPPTTDIRGLRAEILSRIQIFTILSDFERFLAIYDQVLAILDPYTHNDVNYTMYPPPPKVPFHSLTILGGWGY